MKRYFYARVSSKEQNLDRQLEAARYYKHEIDEVFADKQSGKNFEREQYQKMKAGLQRGDEVIIKELDRLGRNKDLVKEELQWFKDNGIIVRILDIPTTLIDFGTQEWVSDMVTNILVEVMGSIAEQERIKIQARQREGIELAKARGVKFGKEPMEVDVSLLEGENITEACKRLGISRNTYYRRMNSCRA